MRRIPRTELPDDMELLGMLQSAGPQGLHKRFSEEFKQRFRVIDRARTVELGCGLGLLSLPLARANPRWVLDGVDTSRSAVKIANSNATAMEVAGRVQYHWSKLPVSKLKAGSYEIVISAGMLHRVRDPALLWQEVSRLARPGAHVMIMDLLRPSNAKAAKKAVMEYAPDAPNQLKRDLHASFMAAYVPRELMGQLSSAGLSYMRYTSVDERYLMAWGTTPSKSNQHDSLQAP